jgi:hypothetical protein
MSVEDIKKALSGLSAAEQNEVSAFLFHLRRRSDATYQATLAERMSDKDPSHWLTPEEFERRLDAN